MEENFIGSFGSMSINKLRDSGMMIDEVGVHGGCAHSQSYDSGLVADIDQLESTVSRAIKKGHYRSNSSDYHGDRTSSYRYRRNLASCRSLSNSLVEQRNGHMHMNGETKSLNGISIAVSENGLHGVVDVGEHDQSVDTIKDLDQSLSSIGDDEFPSMENANQSNHSSSPSNGNCKCSTNHSDTDSSGVPSSPEHFTNGDGHNDFDSEPPMKLDPNMLDLQLNLERVGPGRDRELELERERTRHKSGCSDCGSDIRKKSRHKHDQMTVRTLPPKKQSWLLRLFESKLFDMSIGITYLFNSKEPGVQTYIGKSFVVIVICRAWIIYIFLMSISAFKISQYIDIVTTFHSPYFLAICRTLYFEKWPITRDFTRTFVNKHKMKICSCIFTL